MTENKEQALRTPLLSDQSEQIEVQSQNDGKEESKGEDDFFRQGVEPPSTCKL